MNTLIRVRGWVTESYILNPEDKITEPEKIHRLRIQPADPLTFHELEVCIEELKQESQRPNSPSTYRHDDDVIDGCEIIMKSFFKPKLYGAFENVERDDELLGKYVQAVGHLKILADGNVFLSVHIIEDAYYDDFDPMK